MTLEFGKAIPAGEDWKEGWSHLLHKDKVFFSEDDAIVGLDLAPRCASHSKDVFCRKCILRLKDAVMAAERVIDPRVSAEVVEVEGTHSLPPYMALINRIAKNGFAMKLQRNIKISAKKPIYTTKCLEDSIDGPIMVVDYTSQQQVCDCQYLRSFYVRLADPLPDRAYIERFWNAKLSFIVDGYRLVDQAPIKDLLSQKEVVFVDTEKSALFSASMIDEKCVLSRPEIPIKNEFAGYMTPNGTRFKVELEGIPGGGGLVHLEVGWDLPEYTTRRVELNTARTIS